MSRKGGEGTKRIYISFSFIVVLFIAMLPTSVFASISSGEGRLLVMGDLGREVYFEDIYFSGSGTWYSVKLYSKDNKLVFTNTSQSGTSLNSSINFGGISARYITVELGPNSTLNSVDFGVASNRITVFSPLSPPKAPVGLEATAGNGTVDLSWTTTDRATSYEIYVDGLMSKTSTTPSVSFSNLTNGKEYSFYVVAINAQGSSPPSVVVRATPKAPPPPPPPPDTTPPSVPVLNGKPGKNQAVLTWTQSPESDLAGYNVYQDGTKVGNYTTNAATISGLKNGTEYKFQVTSIDTTGNESAKSNQVAVTPVEKMDVNLIPNGDSIVVQIVSGGTGPYVINWGAAQKTVDQSQYVIPNLSFDTEYTVTITDANGLTYSAKVNTGTEKGYTPPSFPNPQEMFQKMLNVFGTAGTIAMAIIGGAIALGILCVLAMWAWRLLRNWLARAK